MASAAEIVHPTPGLPTWLARSLPGNRGVRLRRLGDRPYPVCRQTASAAGYSCTRPILFPGGNSTEVFVAHKGNKWMVVANGVEGREYDYVRTPVLTPDRSRLAYVAEKNGREVLVVGSQEVLEGESLGFEAPVFTDGGRRVCCQVMRQGRWETVARECPATRQEPEG